MIPMSPRRLSTIVKDLRLRRGMSQRELAKMAGVTDPYITLLETNQRKNPSLTVLKPFRWRSKATASWSIPQAANCTSIWANGIAWKCRFCAAPRIK